MSLPNPRPIAAKTSNQTNEVATATSISDLQRYFSPLILKVSKNTPPLTVDVKELQWTFDKTALRLYLKVDGVMHYVQFT